MARWVAIFQDDSKALKVREEHHEMHFTYLKQHSAKIRLAGGLRNEPGGTFCGGLWIVEAESRDEVKSLCENDPYFRYGLRRGYEIYAWGKAPIYGDVVL